MRRAEPLPRAAVTITNRETGLKRAVTTDEEGRFNFPQLPPGTYAVEVEAPGFEKQRTDNVVSSLGQKQTVDFTLKLAQSQQTIEVSGEAPLINPGNANTCTTLDAPALENLPNPGGDLTYPLQFAAGALMNTAGSGNDFVGSTNGYGNVEFNGLPALSNGYIVDGLETNDPLTNLNSGLSTNLVLGLNSISEVTVNTLSYSVDQGRYGASQVNYVTKSGTNQFHGNLYEIWNGAALNAADYFTNATAGNHKPGSNVNHFGGSVGGPILHNKLFFFFDTEWVRIALPIVTPATVPTLAFESYVLQQLPLGGTDSVTGSVYPAAPCPGVACQVPFYTNMFKLFGNTSGTPLAVLGCPFNADGSQAAGSPPDGNGCANRQSVSHSSDDHEQVQTVRVDYNMNANNTGWLRFQADTGLQAAWTDPINPIFDALSPQPLYSVAAGYTHVFSQNLVNYFNPGFSWYSSLFAPSDLQKTLAAFPMVLEGSGANAPFTTIGGLDNTWLQGRRASRVFLNDNLAWTHGAHELRFGTNTRILLLNDYDFDEGTVPTVTYATLPQFIHGVASTATETFPLTANEPFDYVNLDLYVQDTWKVTPKVTWTFGIRDSLNSNPLNPHDEVARLPGSFDSISHDVNQPLDAVIQTHLGNLFASTPLAIWQPRTAIAWQFAPNTVLRTGFGIFSDILPGSVADIIGMNPPYVQSFQGGLLGTVGGTAIAPGVSQQRGGGHGGGGSSVRFGICAGRAFLRIAAGQSSSVSPARQHHRRAGWQTRGAVLYAMELRRRASDRKHSQPPRAIRGHASAESALSDASERLSDGVPGLLCSIPLPGAERSRFGAVTQFSTGASSHYNGLQLNATKQLGHGLQGQVNYTLSRCMDEVSNGGLLQFSAGAILSPLPGELARNYGPCDYDVRHNLTGEYAYQLPLKVRSRGLAGC